MQTQAQTLQNDFPQMVRVTFMSDATINQKQTKHTTPLSSHNSKKSTTNYTKSTMHENKQVCIYYIL